MGYLSCEFVENGMCFIRDAAVLCSYSMCMKFEAIKIIEDYKGELFDWEKIRAIKQEYRDRFAKGDIPPICKGCPSLQVKDWDGSMQLKYILINHWENCQLDCIYCHTHQDKKYLNSLKPWKILPVLKDALKQNMLSYNGNVNITGGEPTILKEFPDLMKFFLEKTNIFIMINSAAVDYSKWIKKGLEKRRVMVTISLDAGTRETYKKIKNVDKFKKVIDNIKKYKKHLDPIQTSLIGMKYIFIPGYNDTLEEVQSWLKIVEDLGLTNIQLELEHHWYQQNQYLPDNVKEYIELVIDYVHKHKCNLAFREILTTCGYTEAIRYIDNGR